MTFLYNNYLRYIVYVLGKLKKKDQHSCATEGFITYCDSIFEFSETGIQHARG